MRILALDTATEMCSAALLIGAEISERQQLAPQRHAALILPMLEAVLGDAGVAIEQLDALAFGRGPGSFTGVRIAASVVQGIAFAADLPVVPISTLAAIAQGAIREHQVERVVAAIDARMGEIYWGAYRGTADGGVIGVGQEQVCRPGAIALAEEGEWFGAGSGWSAYFQTLQRYVNVRDWRGDCYPQARDIAVLAKLAYRRGEIVTAERALPVYLRDEVASAARK